MTNRTQTTLRWRCLTILAVLLAWVGMAWGNIVAPAVGLTELTQQADIIFKGTAVSSSPVKDEWFKSGGYCVAYETKFKVVSTIKGEAPSGKLAFRHFDRSPHPDPHMAFTFMPQNYHFEAGRTYIVFAKKAETVGLFRQLWRNAKWKGDQGAVLCANDRPVASKEIRDALWTELTAMLASRTAADAAYAIRQLDEMSDDQSDFPFPGLSDFGRQEVAAAVLPLVTHRDAKVALAAIGAVGSHNPYMSDERARHWLATVGSAVAPGMGVMNPKMRNVGGELYWKDLVALADAKGTTETRAAAIRALGLVRELALREAVERWLADPAPAVRAAATVLLADFPGPETRQRLTALAGDPASEVRIAVAHAIGYSQQTEMAAVLGQLLTDAIKKVRQAATMCLLSFSPKNEAVAEVFRASLQNREFSPLFLLSLARENPADHLDDLAQVVERNLRADVPWGGLTPVATAWDILFKYLAAQPAEKIRAGEFDRYLAVLGNVGPYSPPDQLRDLYAFYLQRGMTERAKGFREAAKKTVTRSSDQDFNVVDKNPSQYQRK